jgi:hypothetical protein
MHVVNGHEFDGTESSVDLSDEFVDYRSEVLVLFDILPGRNGELYEDDLGSVGVLKTGLDGEVLVRG